MTDYTKLRPLLDLIVESGGQELTDEALRAVKLRAGSAQHNGQVRATIRRQADRLSKAVRGGAHADDVATEVEAIMGRFGRYTGEAETVAPADELGDRSPTHYTEAKPRSVESEQKIRNAITHAAHEGRTLSGAELAELAPRPDMSDQQATAWRHQLVRASERATREWSTGGKGAARTIALTAAGELGADLHVPEPVDPTDGMGPAELAAYLGPRPA